jgi:hypothetical protein
MWILCNNDNYDYFGAKILVQATLNQETSYLSIRYNPKFTCPKIEHIRAKTLMCSKAIIILGKLMMHHLK